MATDRNEMSRRRFTATTSFAAAAVVAGAARRVLGANDRVRLGIIGTGGRGSYLMGVANKVGGIEWVAVCDAWDERCARAAKIAKKSPS